MRHGAGPAAAETLSTPEEGIRWHETSSPPRTGGPPGSPPMTRRTRTRRSRRSSRVRAPDGAPNVLVVLLDDVGFGASSAFGGVIDTPNAERLAAGGLKYNRFHTTALCSPTRAALLSGRNHHTVGMGGITEIATAAPGYSSQRPNDCAPARRDPQAQRLLDGAVRQVPRGAGVGDEPDGPVRELADRQRLRVLLRLHRGRGAPVLPGALRGDDAGRAVGHARGGLPPHGRHDRQGDRLGPLAEVADARQAVLRLLRAGRDARPAPRARRSGWTSTRAASTPAGTRCARRSSRARRSSA